jgi:hypothetical protein
MDIFKLALVSAVISWPLFLIVLVIYYEIRRAKRIAANLPLEDIQPRGFDVELQKHDQTAAAGPRDETMRQRERSP